MKIYLHYLSFLSTEMVQVNEILPYGGQGPSLRVNTMVDDVLVMQGARASAAMLWT